MTTVDQMTKGPELLTIESDHLCYCRTVPGSSSDSHGAQRTQYSSHSLTVKAKSPNDMSMDFYKRKTFSYLHLRQRGRFLRDVDWHHNLSESRVWCGLSSVWTNAAKRAKVHCPSAKLHFESGGSPAGASGGSDSP